MRCEETDVLGKSPAGTLSQCACVSGHLSTRRAFLTELFLSVHLRAAGWGGLMLA